MSTKSLVKQKRLQTSDLTEKGAAAWIAENMPAINKDLAAARKSLRAGQSREWNFSKFIAKAQKRPAANKKK